jgi:hypothetical protein
VDRVGRGFLVGDDEIVQGPSVHGAGQSRIGSAVDQDPYHAQRGIEPYGDRIPRGEAPRGLDLAKEMGAGVGGNQGDVVPERVVLGRRDLEREE